MVLIALVAIEVAALRQATEPWCNIARYLTIGALIVASLLARHCTGAEGAWWFGFALFGWAYYILGLDTLAHGEGVVQPNSIVSRILEWFLWLYYTGDQAALESLGNHERVSYQIRIMQAIMIILVACTGGLFCWLMARRRPLDESQRA
jgi:hypothetical protein